MHKYTSRTRRRCVVPGLVARLALDRVWINGQIDQGVGYAERGVCANAERTREVGVVREILAGFTLDRVGIRRLFCQNVENVVVKG